MVIVRAQHFCRHGLAEPAAPRDTAEAALRKERAVHDGNEPGFIYVLAVPDTLKEAVPDIDVCSHGRYSIAVSTG